MDTSARPVSTWKGWFLMGAMAALVLRLIWSAIGMEHLPHFPRDPLNRLQDSEIRFHGEILGPESLAFDAHGRGPYTGLADGRIVRWNGPSRHEWTEFAFTSPLRSSLCTPLTFKPENEHICGRPLGLRFRPGTEDLYIADSYHGLYVVGPEGGAATPVVTKVNGAAIAFANDVDFGEEGLIYFTDSSTQYGRSEFIRMLLEGDNTGRLLSHDLATKETKVLQSGLYFPNGIALNADKSFLVMSETSRFRLLRYWLKGPEMGTLDVFADLPGFPDNVRLTERGDFWVAIPAQPNAFMRLPIWLRKVVLKLPFLPFGERIAKQWERGMVVRLSPEGQVLEVLEDRDGKVVKSICNVEERNGVLWMGSVIRPHIAVYSRRE